MNRLMQKGYVFILSLGLILGAPWIAQASDIVLNLHFDQPDIQDVTIDSTNYKKVTANEMLSIGDVGRPQLPVKGIKVAIPAGKQYSSAEVSFGTAQEIFLDHLVTPMQDAFPLSHPEDIVPTAPDSAVYSMTTAYPTTNVALATQQNMVGYKIAIFNVFPVKYIPSENKLLYYPDATLTIHLANAKGGSAPELPARAIQADWDRVHNFIDNKDDLPGLPLAKDVQGTVLLGQQGPFDYVIITNQTLKNSTESYKFQDLIAYRQSKGLTATIVTTDDPVNGIYANYSGARPDGGVDNQTKIRNFIKAAYQYWGTQYVLLGGDGEGEESGNGIIPAKGLYANYDWRPLNLDMQIASDLYYACLDGTMDHSANGSYGEVFDGEDGGEIDLLAEVFVGRAPADTVQDVSNFVRKTLAYEQAKTSYDPYLFKTTQLGEHLGFGGVAEYASSMTEEVRLSSSAHGYSTMGFKEVFDNPETLYESPSMTVTKNDVYNLINQNVGAINHDGHGNVKTVFKITNSDLTNLTNNKYFIGYSQACYSGSFDNRDILVPWQGGCNCTLPYDSIAENLVKGQNGAVAFVANSRYGWGMYESTDGPSQYFAREFWDAIFGEHIFALGKASQDSKEDNIPFIQYYKKYSDIGMDFYLRYVYLESNFFGDPALEIFMPVKRVPADYTTIQAAINAATPNYDKVVVAPGTYTMTQNWGIMMRNGVDVKSLKGPYETIIDCGGFDGCVQFNNTSSGVLEGFTFKNFVGNNGAIRMEATLGNVTVKNNIIKGGNTGIKAETCNGSKILNNTIYHPTGKGIYLWDTYDSLVIKNNIIDGIGSGQSVYGVYNQYTFDPYPIMDYNDVYNFQYNFKNVTKGPHDKTVDPLFIDEASDNLHLQRNSVAIDGGDPADLFQKEPVPSGNRVNMGADGNTFYTRVSGNRAPELNPIGDKEGLVSNSMSFQITGQDPDNDLITFLASNTPSGASFNSASGVFNWTPTCSQTGIHYSTFGAKDSYGSLSNSEMISLYVPNDTAPNLNPISNQSVKAGDLLYFYVSASDPENQTISYSVQNNPSGSGFFEWSPNYWRFYWSPGTADIGTHNVTFKVQDPCGLLDTETITINVTSTNPQQPHPRQCGCFLGGTPILMADGTQKSIEKVKVGDEILAFDEKTKELKPDKVTEFFAHTSDEYLLINGKLKVTPNHPVYSQGQWLEVGQLKLGDKMLTAKGQEEVIRSMKLVQKKVKTYNLEVNPYHTYVAGGYVVHNKIRPIPCDSD